MKYLKYIPVILWMALIFYFSSKSDLPKAESFFWEFVFKKSGHIFVYTVLAIIWILTLDKNKYMNSFLYSFAYAFTDEIHQIFVPNRTGLLRDVYIDSLGILAGLLLFNLYSKWQKKLMFPMETKKQNK